MSFDFQNQNHSFWILDIACIVHLLIQQQQHTSTKLTAKVKLQPFMMKDVVIHFGATFSLPPLCRGQDFSGGKNAESSHEDDKSQQISVHNDSDTNSYSDPNDVEVLTSPSLVHELCQDIRQAAVSCRADIYFDTVVKDIFSISKDISLHSSENSFLLLPDIEWDTGFGILINSCALQHGGEDPTALFLPNPEPGYFEITKDLLHAYSKDDTHTITVEPNLDLNRVFYHELDRLHRVMNSTRDTKIGQFDRSRDLSATDRQLIEQNILVYDRTLQILFVFLGIMVILFFDLYLHFQKQKSKNDAEWNGTPLVVLLSKLYTSGKVHLCFCVRTVYDTSTVWKNKLVHWSCAVTETIARCKQSAQNDMKLKVCAVVAKMSLVFDRMHAFLSVSMWSFVTIFHTLCRLVQYVRSTRSWIVHVRALIRRLVCACTLKLRSNLLLLIQAGWISFIDFTGSVTKSYRTLKARAFVWLKSSTDKIKTSILSFLQLMKWAFVFWRNLFFTKLGLKGQRERTRMEGENTTNHSEKTIKTVDAVERHQMSPICTYDTYPELVRTGLDESELTDVAVKRDRQLQIYECSLVSSGSKIDDEEGEDGHHSFEHSSDDSMNTSGTDAKGEKSVHEWIEKHSDFTPSSSEEDVKLYDKADQSERDTPLLCESSSRGEGHEDHCSDTTVVANATTAKGIVENDISIAVEEFGEEDVHKQNRVSAGNVTKAQEEKHCAYIDSSEKIRTIDQSMDTKVGLDKQEQYRYMNVELKEKLKLRFDAISSRDETITNNENVVTATTSNEIYPCIRGETNDDDNVADISSSSLKMEIKNYLMQKDMNNKLSPDRLKNKNKTFSKLMAQWGANASPQISSPEETGSFKDRHCPKKLSSPFLNHDVTLSKVKKITPVKENKPSSHRQKMTSNGPKPEDPLSFLNSMLE